MRLILNIIWFVLAGLWMAIAYTLAALICFILIITIPFGIAALRIAVFALWPFGKTVVRRHDAGPPSCPKGQSANTRSAETATERDRDDQDEADQRRERIGDRHPEAGEHEPEDV